MNLPYRQVRKIAYRIAKSTKSKKINLEQRTKKKIQLKQDKKARVLLNRNARKESTQLNREKKRIDQKLSKV
jgi:hypothetical protein